MNECEIKVEDKELRAMAVIAKALSEFSDNESDIVRRILRWAGSRYGVDSFDKRSIEDRCEREGGEGKSGNPDETEDFAGLYHKANPRTDAERALVAGFWCQRNGGTGDFTGQEINAMLKDLGHRVGNITDALTSLNRRSPSLVMQTAKSGRSRQARKKYRLTHAGISEVEWRVGAIDGGAAT